MLESVTNSFKSKMKKYGKQLNMLLNFKDTTLDKKYVKKAELSVNGELFTSIMRQITLEIEDYEIIGKVFTVREINNMKVGIFSDTSVKKLYKENREDIFSSSVVNLKLGVRTSEFEDYEYIDFGEFVVFDKENIVDTNSKKLYLYDHLIDTHIKYDDDPLNLDYSTGEITVLVLLQAICDKFGFNLLTTDFTNANKIIDTDKYINQDVTYRDILDELSATVGGFIKIFNKDLSVAYPTETGEIIDEDDLEKLTIGKKIGPFNTIVLGRSPQEDNIFYPQVVDKVGIRIDNNQIMDSHREDFIQGIYERINGLQYYAFDFSSFGFGYFEFGDIVTLKNLKGELFKTILFNIVENVDTGIKGKSYTEETNYSETKYKCATSIEKRLKNTEIICNKQEGKIEMLVEEIGDRTEKTTTLTEDIDGIKTQVKSFADVTNEAEGWQNIEIEDCLEGHLLSIKIIGDNEVFSGPVLSDDKVLSNNLVLFGSSTIRVTHIDKENNEIIKDYDLKISEVLRRSDKYFDEVVIEDGKEFLIKRIFISSNNQVIINETGEKIFIQDLDINVNEGFNKIEILEYNPWFEIKYVKLNEFTKQFATTVELQTQILQLANSIALLVKEKVGTNEFQTAFTQLSNSISAVAQGKIGQEELIAKLNIAIKDNQGVIELIGNVVKIVSDYFTLDEEGHIKIKSNGAKKYMYTQLDIFLAVLSIREELNLPQTLFDLYDVNSDNDINFADIITIANTIRGVVEPIKSINATVDINPDRYDSAIELKISDELKTAIGLFTIYSYFISSKCALFGDRENLNALKGIFINGDTSEIDVYSSSGSGDVLTQIKNDTITTGSISQTSDKRLKKDIDDVDEKLLDLINEIEFKQFKFKDKDTTHFGIIAQDLIEISNKYNINIFDYQLVDKYKRATEEYYTVNYTELLILKNKMLERNQKSILERLKKLEDMINE